MRLNIIIPTYNEERNIRKVIEKIISCVTIEKYMIIVVDDGSTDNTVQVVKNFVANYPHIKIFISDYHQGFGRIVREGIKMISSDETFVPLMADGCDEIEIINSMYSEICRGADVVCASRYMKGGKREGGSLVKAFGSYLINLSCHLMCGVSCHDLTNSFKMFRKKVVDSLKLESYGFDIFMELILKAYIGGYKIIELPTIWKAREKGRTHFCILKDGHKYIRWLLYGILNK